MQIKHFLFSLLALIFTSQAKAQCPAIFTYTLQPNGTAIFTSTGSNSMFTNYYWTFGNGTSGVGITATTIYNTPGTYLACLYVVDSMSNCSDSSCVAITITNGTNTCNAAFTHSVQSNNLNLFSTGSNSSTASYDWYVNGSWISSSMTPTYTFTTGTYNVCLVVTDVANSCVDSVCQTLNLTVGGAGCQALYTYAVGSGGVVTFAANTSLNASTATYQWVINNSVYNGSNLTYSFPQSGVYQVCLIVYDSLNNCMDSTCNNVTVNTSSSGCNALFTYSTNPSGISLNASSMFSTGVYTWLLNGNVIGTGPTFVYAASAGTYTICLAVSDTLNNCTDTTCQTITVGANACQANFFVYPDSLGPPHTYVGVNTSVGTNLTYLWTWGDGTSSTGAYPSHTYASPGTYMICLYITSNSTNCNDSICLNTGILKATAMYTVNFQAPSSIDNIVKERLSIYPNPAGETFRIQGSSSKTLQIEILSLNGSVMKSIRSSVNEDIQISSLSQGMYTLRVKEENGSSHYIRFVKE